MSTRVGFFYPTLAQIIDYIICSPLTVLLAHLSRRLMGELVVYQPLQRLSSIRPSKFSNIFSSETGPRSAVGKVSGYRCVSDCRSRGREFGVYLLDFFCSGIQFNLLLSPYPCFISLLYLDLYVLGDDALIS